MSNSAERKQQIKTNCSIQTDKTLRIKHFLRCTKEDKSNTNLKFYSCFHFHKPLKNLLVWKFVNLCTAQCISGFALMKLHSFPYNGKCTFGFQDLRFLSPRRSDTVSERACSLQINTVGVPFSRF